MNNHPLRNHLTNRSCSPALSSLNISGFSSRNSYDIAPTASRTNCSEKTSHRCIGKIYQDPENNYWIESLFEGKIVMEGQPLEKKVKKQIFSGDNLYFSEGQKEAEVFEDEIEDLEFKDKVKEDWEEEVKCPICLHCIRNCVTLIPCAHIFCSSCVSIQLRKSTLCPVCREEIKSFRKNTMVDKICQILVEARPSSKRTREEEKEMDENDDIMKGFRVITYQDGSVYRGFCKGNKREGQGILIKQDGEKYEGEWRNDKKEGKGEIIWANGEIYRGDFVENRREGQGEYLWRDGARYKGEFVKNMIEGRGEYCWSNGVRYEGEFNFLWTE